MDARHLFEGRRLLIATKHGKEQVIAPLVEKSLGVTAHTSADFDTDLLGTFTGEVERGNDPLATLRQKSRMAMEQFGYDLAIASEGSFGPHPSAWFAAADDELVILTDSRNGFEIIERELSLQTNFAGETITSEVALGAFVEKALFPSHRLIIRRDAKTTAGLVKGIDCWDALLEAWRHTIEEYGSAYVETDMRAHHNPTRMKVIERATEKLLEKVHSLCPSCSTPGFGITRSIRGLPCSLCQQPTQSTLAFVCQCAACGHESEQRYPNGKTEEDPMYCNYCNP